MKAFPMEKWDSEAAMFASFLAFVRGLGFRVYPESCGHDAVIVVPDPLPEIPGLRDHRSYPGDGYECWWGHLKPGDVIAIEGKLRPSVEVLHQAMPPERGARWRAARYPAMRDAADHGAHWYAVLVPGCDDMYRAVAHAVGVTVIQWPNDKRPAGAPDDADYARYHRGYWRAPDRRDATRFYPAVRRNPSTGLDLPEVEVDQAAGESAPRRITPWKIDAVKLCLLGMERILTAQDVGGLARNFVENGWLVRNGRGKAATYTLASKPNRPDIVYPEIVAALRKAAS